MKERFYKKIMIGTYPVYLFKVYDTMPVSNKTYLAFISAHSMRKPNSSRTTFLAESGTGGTLEHKEKAISGRI